MRSRNAAVAALLIALAAGLIDPRAARAQPAPELLPRLEDLRPDRPRLLLRPKETPLAVSVRQLREMPRGKTFDALLARLQKSEAAHAQAMVWLLTGDDAAAARAVTRMRGHRFDPAKADSFEVFFRLTEFAYAYDWLHGHPALDDDARRAVRAAALPLAEHGLRMAQDHVFHNYTWMSAGGVAAWALAAAGEGDAAADALYAKVRDRFERELWPAMRYLDGLPCEPMGYWTQYVFAPAVMTVLAAQSAGERDLCGAVRDRGGDWLARNLDTLAHGTLPDLRFVPFGDLQGGPNGGVTRNVAGLIDAARWAVARSPDARGPRNGAAAADALAQRIEAVRGAERFRDDSEVLYMIYTRALTAAAGREVGRGGAAADERALRSFVAGGAGGGHWVARLGGWGDDATVVGFRCADHLGDHNHWDQGGFFVYRRGLLAVDPPVYRKTRGPQQRTDYHNTLLVGGRPQRPVRGQTFGTLDAFRQNLTAGKRLETGNLFASADAPFAAAGEFAQAYDVPELAGCVRQIAVLEPGTVIVVDRLTAKPGAAVPDVSWLLNLPAAPTRDGGDAWVATNGAAWIRCRRLLGDAAGGVPAVEAIAEMNTHRLTLAYRGGADVLLVHALDVGDGAAPDRPAPAATARRGADAVEVTVNGQRVTFSLRPPYKARR